MFTHHAQLIVGSHENAINLLKNKLEENGVSIIGNPDIFIFEEDLLGVDEARTLTEMQSRKAISGGKKIFIVMFRQATREAQNALLKTLEEPTAETYFFIITPQEKALLPTLRSRLSILSLTESNTDKTEQAKQFASASPSKRMEQVDNIIKEKDKSEVLKLLNGLEVEYEKSSRYHEAGESLIVARNNLATRSPSLKLILEHLALTLPKI